MLTHDETEIAEIGVEVARLIEGKPLDIAVQGVAEGFANFGKRNYTLVANVLRETIDNDFVDPDETTD